MDRRLLKSALSLLVIFAIGGGATYALTTNGQATISNNQLSASSGDLKLCDADQTDSEWQKSIEGNLNADGLAPDGPAVELTDDRNIWIGNDDGTLEDEVTGDCDEYEGEEGDSSVALNIFPTVSYEDATCAHPDRFELSFAFNGEGAATGFKTLDQWATNTTTQINGPVEAGDAEELIINAQLDDDAVSSDTCKFDIHFTGIQDNTPEPLT